MKKILLIFALLISFGLGYFTKYRSIKNEGWKTFVSSKWKPYEQGVHGENYRKQMIFDLTYNVLQNGTEKKMNIKKIFELLGKNKIIETEKGFKISYEVEEKYGWNIDPEGGTILNLTFDKDSILQNWVINEFWHKP